MNTHHLIIVIIITLFSTLSFNTQAQNLPSSTTAISTLTMALNVTSVTSEDEKGDAANAPLILQSTLTCPKCSHEQTEVMDTKSCKYFYKCGKCEEMVKSEKGQCCVFCSFANVPCPPKQEYQNKGGE